MSERLAGMVTVYAYKCWDQQGNRFLLMDTKATVEALVRMPGATPVADSAEDVPLSAITQNGLYRPPILSG